MSSAGSIDGMIQESDGGKSYDLSCNVKDESDKDVIQIDAGKKTTGEDPNLKHAIELTVIDDEGEPVVTSEGYFQEGEEQGELDFWLKGEDNVMLLTVTSLMAKNDQHYKGDLSITAHEDWEFPDDLAVNVEVSDGFLPISAKLGVDGFKKMDGKI